MHVPAYLTLRIRAPEKAGSLLLGKDDVHSKCKATSSTPRKAAGVARGLILILPTSSRKKWRVPAKLNPAFALKELLRPLYSSHRDDPRPAWILSPTVY
jgi:hypothetical protein